MPVYLFAVQLGMGEITTRLLMAAVLGAILGLEREIHGRPAGLRTLMLVSLGCAGFVLIGIQAAPSATPNSTTGLDLTRIVQGVMQGIGFIGAGAVLRSGDSVKGITSAAVIWIVGTVGTACGFGSYGIAAVSGGLALLILIVLGQLERRVMHQTPD